jgi:hypothetical protein
MSTTATYTCAVAATPEETLAEEAGRRTKAGASAIAAGLLTLAGALLTLKAASDFPPVRLLDALRYALATQPAAGPGPVARKVLYFDDHVAQVVAVQIVPALATALVGVTLIFLYLSTRARNPLIGRLPLIGAVAGAVLVVVPGTVGVVALVLDAGTFADSAVQSEQAARDVLDSSVAGAAFTLAQLGTLAIGVAFALTALNAMRVGLLTRFMGVLGIIAGTLVALSVLFLVSVEGGLPFVRIFWLLALGALFLGHWPGGMPPAWVTGEAQPWPTQQEIREQRMALQAQRSAGTAAPPPRRPRRGRADPPETPAPEPPARKPHPSSKKKKRKRRDR